MEGFFKAVVMVLAIAMQGCEPGGSSTSAIPWNECVHSSNWDGPNAEKRMMNVLSPHFPESKVDEYLDWQEGRGCDHVHLLLVNGENGEGGGYDALLDDTAREMALQRVKSIRRRGLGIVLWIVSDESDSYRRAIFSDPSAYAERLSEFFPYASYVVLGLEMDEGFGHIRGWTALRDAVRSAGWTGPGATHHTSGGYPYAKLGQIVMDQLERHCSPSQVAASVSTLRRSGYAVCGFEYSRHADRAKAQAALDAGAFGCGNW